MVPVFKAGICNDASKYCPISLTYNPCELVEHITYKQTFPQPHPYSFSRRAEPGFCYSYLCESELFKFTMNIHLNLDFLFQTDIIYLDFSKAFDCVLPSLSHVKTFKPSSKTTYFNLDSQLPHGSLLVHRNRWLAFRNYECYFQSLSGLRAGLASFLNFC